MERLRRQLAEIDGQGYKAYKRLAGDYAFPGFTLTVDHVQGDPFADPSRLCVTVPAATAGLPAALYATAVRRTAVEDALGRAFAAAAAARIAGPTGSGNSGLLSIACGGQQVLQRNAIHVTAFGIEARVRAGLPARGRRILGAAAERLLLEQLPGVVAAALCWAALPQQAMRRHVASVEDQAFLRDWLAGAGLVAFLADGSRLPRASGIDDRPLAGAVVELEAPASLAVEVELPNRGRVRGLGIPRGVTLVVGGGFHGKSTLLQALECGVYDHVPGDGRDGVATDPGAVKIRAEDGRAVTGVDISPFIDNLPLGRDTHRFTTGNASGSTSQAANILEALACGCRLLLLDEDTSAGNFMIRDARMQQLVSAAREPITPLLHRVRTLYERHGVSTVLVMGGSGDYFAVADTVLLLDTYRVHDATAAARRLAGPLPAAATRSAFDGSARRVDPRSLDPRRGDPKGRIQARGTGLLRYGGAEIDLHRVAQLVDPGQLLAIGYLLHRLAGLESPLDPVAALDSVLATAIEHGLDGLAPHRTGSLARPRLHEALAALNRLRGLHVVESDERSA